jgi:hypothetical protein
MEWMSKQILDVRIAPDHSAMRSLFQQELEGLGLAHPPSHAEPLHKIAAHRPRLHVSMSRTVKVVVVVLSVRVALYTVGCRLKAISSSPGTFRHV